MQNHSGCIFNLDRYVYYRPRLEGFPRGCQFKSQGAELTTVEEKRYCVFHLPSEQKKNWDDSQVNLFNRKIVAILNKAKIHKSLADLSGVVFPGTIRFGLKSSEPTRLPGALFLRCTFLGDTEFDGVVFEDIVLFNDSHFHEQALLYNVRFEGEAHFDGAKMGPNVLLVDSHFNSHAYFQGTHLNGNLSCSNTTFDGRAWFQSARLGGYTYFLDCTFTGEADFGIRTSKENCLEFEAVTFSGSRFRSRASFINRQFLGHTDFSGVTFEVAPEFHGCVLHQDIDFSGAKFLDRGNVTLGENLGTYSQKS